MPAGVRRIVPVTLGWEDLPRSVSVEGASRSPPDRAAPHDPPGHFRAGPAPVLATRSAAGSVETIPSADGACLRLRRVVAAQDPGGTSPYPSPMCPGARHAIN
jgi:hypothetical protein